MADKENVEQMQNATGMNVSAQDTVEFIKFMTRPIKELEHRFDELVDSLEADIQYLKKEILKPPVLIAENKTQIGKQEARANSMESKLGEFQNRLTLFQPLDGKIVEVEAQLKNLMDRACAIPQLVKDVQQFCERMDKLENLVDNLEKRVNKEIKTLEEKDKQLELIQREAKERVAQINNNQAVSKERCDEGYRNLKEDLEKFRGYCEDRLSNHTHTINQNRTSADQNLAQAKMEFVAMANTLQKEDTEAHREIKSKISNLMKELEEATMLAQNMEIMEKRLEKTFLMVKEIRVHLNL